MLVNEVRRVQILNEPATNYRDGLFAKLPSGKATFLLGLTDYYDRARSGFPSRELLGRLTDRIVKWSEEASPADARAVLNAVVALSEQPVPDYYSAVRPDGATGNLVWTTAGVQMVFPEQFREMSDALNSAIGKGAPAEKPGAFGRGGRKPLGQRPTNSNTNERRPLGRER